MTVRNRITRVAVSAGLLGLVPSSLWAHGVALGDRAYLQGLWGPMPIPLAYLGAKHMVTGYDHLLFLLGVIFFLYRLKDIAFTSRSSPSATR